MTRVIGGLCALLVVACQTASSSYLVLATTTSVAYSGLLEALLPQWQHGGGPDIRPALAGSGRALAMLERGDADVAISHAPDAEAALLTRHPRWHYRKFMFNEFVLVGPASDPARVREAGTLDDAMRQLARSDAAFFSRGDESGTHERERALWQAVGTSPPDQRLLVTGAGMAVTLRQASDRGGYTLTDRATFEQLKKNLHLEIVFAGDSRLLNAYAVIVNPTGPRQENAMRFAEWLENGAGREVIVRFTIPGSAVRPFEVWPRGVPADRPAATPP